MQRGRCLDKSAAATEGEVKALRTVAGSLCWVARQCRPDQAGAASTLQGSVSLAVVKDLSDANRAVNRLKQTEDVGLLIHAIPLVKLRTVSISDAALDLDRPDGSTQGGFIVGFTTSELHQQGSAAMSPMCWSSHKVKRSVSASLAGEVFMMSEGLAECEWISGVLESAVYQDYEPSLHRRKSISPPVEPTVTVMKADSHLQIDPSTVCVIDAKSAFDHLVRESTGGHCRRTAQELCVIRRSMQTLRARCRWVPHEQMVVDALTKRHANTITMLLLLRDGVVSIVDEDQELAMRKRTVKSTSVTCDPSIQQISRHAVDVDMGILKDGSSAEALNSSVTDQSPAGTSATILASVRQHGHEEPQEESRDEFEAAVRAASQVEKDTLEVLPTEQVVGGMRRELDLMKGFSPEYEAVPRAEATSKIWSTRWCHRRKGPRVVRFRLVVRQVAKSLDS